MTEYYKLVSQDHELFDKQFEGFGEFGNDNGILDDVTDAVANEMAIQRGEQGGELVWTPVMTDDADTLTVDLDTRVDLQATYRRAMIVQVVHGRVFIEPMQVLEFEGEYYVDVEKIG